MNLTTNKSTEKANGLKRALEKQEVLLVIFLAVIWVALTLANSGWMTAGNLLTITKNLSFYGIIAVGMSFILIQGDADISVGSSAAFGAVFSTWLMLSTKCFGMMDMAGEGWGIALCVVITMAVAALVGFLNSVMVVRMNLPPMIATVATKYSLQGVVGVYSNLEPYTYVVRHQENGFLTDNGADNWLNALEEAIDDQQQRQCCLGNALNLLEQKFTEEQIFAQLLEDLPELHCYKKSGSPCKGWGVGKLIYWLSRPFDLMYLSWFQLSTSGVNGFIQKIKTHLRERNAYKRK